MGANTLRTTFKTYLCCHVQWQIEFLKKKIKPRFLNLNRPRWSDHDFYLIKFFFGPPCISSVWLEMMIILSFDCTMKAGYTFPVTSPYQAEAYDNLNRCPTVARHFLMQPWSLSIHREKERNVCLLSCVCLCLTIEWMYVYKLCMNLRFISVNNSFSV